MKIVVGLGNPGRRYANTRHNVGWMVVDRLADRAGWGGRGKDRDASSVVWGRFNGLDLELVKPLTFMNESGAAVRKVLARAHAPLEEMLVVADDFALPFGRLRLRQAGSAGGHNGLRSIIGELGDQGFARLRVGIGEPGGDAIDHVLATFSALERKQLSEILDAAAEAVEDWARDGTSKAANRWNPWQLGGADAGEATKREGEGAAPAGADEPVTGADGITRTKTGWRRILPSKSEASRDG